MEDPRSRFHKRDSYGYDDTGLLYHININRANGKEYKATVIPRTLIKTVLQEIHNHFVHFGIGKTYSVIKRYYYWPKMIKHIQAHVDSFSLCQREKMQADKYQLQMTEIPKRSFAKVSADLIVELPTSHYNNKNILVMVDHLTRWPFAKAIPNKEVTTVANATFENLYLNMVHLKFLYLTMVGNLPMALWPMCVRGSMLNNILQDLTCLGQVERWRTSISS